MEYKGENNEEIFIERSAEYAILLEKNYLLDVVYDHLKNNELIQDLSNFINPVWGEKIIYFSYLGKTFVVLSVKGSPVAVNAVERIKRTGGKYIVLIGTCGSTNSDIKDGTFILSVAAVRDEGVSSGYLNINVPAIADPKLTNGIIEVLGKNGIFPITGVTFTTDKRYKEDSNELKFLNEHANVVNVDMETSAVLLVSSYHNIKVSVIKIVTDCAVLETKGDLKGVYKQKQKFTDFVNPKILSAFDATIEAMTHYANSQ
jgi:uridine phosphorylase